MMWRRQAAGQGGKLGSAWALVLTPALFAMGLALPLLGIGAAVGLIVGLWVPEGRTNAHFWHSLLYMLVLFGLGASGLRSMLALDRHGMDALDRRGLCRSAAGVMLLVLATLPCLGKGLECWWFGSAAIGVVFGGWALLASAGPLALVVALLWRAVRYESPPAAIL